MEQRIPISEIFNSINGEPPLSGYPSTFVRFYGCNLRCVWCDTKYSYDTGDYTLYDIDKLANKIYWMSNGNSVLVFTGGEPTMYWGVMYKLYEKLKGVFDAFVVETNGTVSLPDYVLNSPNIYWAVSPKLPSAKTKYKISDNRYPVTKTLFKFVTSELPQDLDIIMDEYMYIVNKYITYVTVDDINKFKQLFDLVKDKYNKLNVYIQMHVIAHGRERGY